MSARRRVSASGDARESSLGFGMEFFRKKRDPRRPAAEPESPPGWSDGTDTGPSAISSVDRFIAWTDPRP